MKNPSGFSAMQTSSVCAAHEDFCHAAADNRRTSAALSGLWFFREIREIRSQHQPTIPSEWLVWTESSVEWKSSLIFATDFADFADEDQRTHCDSAAKIHCSQILIEDLDPVVVAIADEQAPHESITNACGDGNRQTLAGLAP
jgi:hypothetical protein